MYLCKLKAIPINSCTRHKQRALIMKKYILLFLVAIVLASCGTEKKEVVYPEITEKGVEPFLLGESFLNIQPQGAFYDTILVEKRYRGSAGEAVYDNILESELQSIYDLWGKEWCDLTSFGLAKIIKDEDTLMLVKFDENDRIFTIEVLSDRIQLPNGVHVGLTATEMFNQYNARFISPAPLRTEMFEEMQFDIPDLPRDIYLIAFPEDRFEITKKGTELVAPLYSIPLEAVKGNSVERIIIDRENYSHLHQYMDVEKR